MDFWPFLLTGIGSVAGNFIFQLVSDGNFEIAFERSYFQIWALVVAYLLALFFN